MPPIFVPEDFDLRGVLLDLSHSGLQFSSDYRRRVTRNDPLMFALVYLIDHLKSPETGDQISLCDFHIDLAESAVRWIRQDFLPSELRECWVAPRECGKSTWMFLILPLWALAHGHRKFVALFADSGGQAEMHLNSLRKELESNEWLRRDFPDLCAPANRRGNRTDADSAKMYVGRNGATIMAKGIDAKVLGAKVGNRRPDYIGLDDVEPKGSSYTPEAKEKRLRDIIDAVFPMNLNAVVQISGTTTMYGSIIHDLVRHALGTGKDSGWIDEQNIKVHYYPPILTDDDGDERSLWPQRWSLKYLNEQRGTRTFALNFMNLPPSSDGGYWDRQDFRYDPPWTAARMILALDPATTSKSTSDDTGISVISVPAHELEVCVEFAIGVKLPPAKLRALVHDLCARNPLIDTIYVETNQGGDYVVDNLRPLPSGIRVETVHEGAPKIARIRQFDDYYSRKWVWHRKRLHALEEQQVAFPNVANDDIVDAAAKGAHYFLRRRPLT